jgi:hypothetical protein
LPLIYLLLLLLLLLLLCAGLHQVLQPGKQAFMSWVRLALPP